MRLEDRYHKLSIEYRSLKWEYSTRKRRVKIFRELEKIGARMREQQIAQSTETHRRLWARLLRDAMVYKAHYRLNPLAALIIFVGVSLWAFYYFWR